MSEEDSIKNQDQEGYRSLWEMLQSPVREAVRARSLAASETPDGFLDLLRFG
jgi:ppGpp synthetase/RelA/SpoT-type nucleotidyltranferase